MCINRQMRYPTPLPPFVDQKFTIHDLWPQDAMDNPVDPYMHTHPCIPKLLTGSSQLPPFNYFKYALQIRASLPAFRINPEDKYKVEEVIELAKGITKFTILGLWPHDAMDDPVIPYTPTHPCIPMALTHSTQLHGILKSLRPSLDTEWPDLKNPLIPKVNLQFWQHEWMKHGTCSNFEHEPLNYFKLHYRFERAYQILELTPKTSIRWKTLSTWLNNLPVQSPKSHATLIASPRSGNYEKYASVIIGQTFKNSSI
ncbi:hypothetical protein GQ457_06G000630 [Hibiscus cannabinus]